jgi:hypothetical protein
MMLNWLFSLEQDLYSATPKERDNIKKLIEDFKNEQVIQEDTMWNPQSDFTKKINHLLREYVKIKYDAKSQEAIVQSLDVIERIESLIRNNSDDFYKADFIADLSKQPDLTGVYAQIARLIESIENTDAHNMAIKSIDESLYEVILKEIENNLYIKDTYTKNENDESMNENNSTYMNDPLGDKRKTDNHSNRPKN